MFPYSTDWSSRYWQISINWKKPKHFLSSSEWYHTSGCRSQLFTLTTVNNMIKAFDIWNPSLFSFSVCLWVPAQRLAQTPLSTQIKFSLRGFLQECPSCFSMHQGCSFKVPKFGTDCLWQLLPTLLITLSFLPSNSAGMKGKRKVSIGSAPCPRSTHQGWGKQHQIWKVSSSLSLLKLYVFTPRVFLVFVAKSCGKKRGVGKKESIAGHTEATAEKRKSIKKGRKKDCTCKEKRRETCQKRKKSDLPQSSSFLQFSPNKAVQVWQAFTVHWSPCS